MTSPDTMFTLNPKKMLSQNDMNAKKVNEETFSARREETAGRSTHVPNELISRHTFPREKANKNETIVFPLEDAQRFSCSIDVGISPTLDNSSLIGTMKSLAFIRKSTSDSKERDGSLQSNSQEIFSKTPKDAVRSTSLGEVLIAPQLLINSQNY